MMKFLFSLPTFFWKKHEEFWFQTRPLLNLAVMRILLCGSLFGLYFSRQWDLTKYYSEAGILPKALSLQIYLEYFRPVVSLSVWPDQYVPYVHGFLVFGLLLLALGIGNRFFNFLIWLISMAFLQRNFSVAFGADLIGNIFLLLLAGTQSCEKLSVLNLIKKSSHQKESDLFTNTFYRLIQVQLCVIYVYTGIEKLKGGSWWDGTALWTVVANPQMVIFDMTWMRHLPYIIVLITFMTILFEIYFPFLVTTAMRIPGLIFGFCFHIGIGFLMALWGFAVIMLAPYALFLTEAELKSLFYRLKLKRFA